MADTLDALLQEFNTGTAAPPPAQPPSQQHVQQAEQERHQRDAAAAEAQHQRNIQAQPAQNPEQALAQAVRMFRSGDLADADEVAAEGYILARSRHDAAFNEAVSSGDARRAAKAIEIARRDYQAVTGHGYVESDRERARASVRGSSRPEEPTEFDARRAGRMSDQEWAADVAKRNGLNVRPPNVWTGDLRSVAASPWSLHDSGRGGGGPPAPGGAGSKARPMIGGRGSR